MTAAAAASILAAVARPARACGGFFCNQPNGPNDQPVAQTAENVLFAMDRAPSGQFALEAHIQIFYTGPADRFSWVVPVDNEPKLGVGSNAVFGALLHATQPSSTLEWRERAPASRPESRPPPAPAAGGRLRLPAGAAAADAAADRAWPSPSGATSAPTTPRSSGPPTAPTPSRCIDWLNANKYFVSPEAARLIADYVREDKYFVAIRLLAGEGVSEIQPLVMRFLGPGPCVPLRLTAIAVDPRPAGQPLGAGRHRVVPDNYFEMEINPARIDWFQGGNNYEELVKEAADQAGGNAFITEYAGPDRHAARADLSSPGRYNLSGDPPAADPARRARSDRAHRASRATAPLLSILRNHIPLPDGLKAMGIDERTFYNQLALYWHQYQAAFKPFNAGALAAELDAKLVTPLRKAQALFDGHPKLTRLATFISPEEMNVDPTFVTNASLPDVPAARTAVATRLCGDRQYDRCNAPVRLEPPGTDAIWFLPKPQPVCYGEASDYERGQLDSMPALYRAWARNSAGEGAARVDKRGEILRRHPRPQRRRERRLRVRSRRPPAGTVRPRPDPAARSAAAGPAPDHHPPAQRTSCRQISDSAGRRGLQFAASPSMYGSGVVHRGPRNLRDGARSRPARTSADPRVPDGRPAGR